MRNFVRCCAINQFELRHNQSNKVEYKLSIINRFTQQLTTVLRSLRSRPVTTAQQYPNAIIIPRQQHGISRKQINVNALKVLYRLHNAGFSAYLVGGSVRDLLLQRAPKDFDVATNAHPEEVRRLFTNCRLIGRRFRLAHVFFGRDIIEVATFRAHHHDADNSQQAYMQNGQIIRDNVYGTIDDDAQRRDFTINALYYNIADFSVVDFSTGMADIQQGIIRILGDPEQRYREDPVRMLRAIRFAVKTGFNIEKNTKTPLFSYSHLLKNVPKARLFEEICKLLSSGQSVAAFAKLEHYQMLAYLLPLTDEHINNTKQQLDQDTILYNRRFIESMLANTDERIANGRPVTPAFFLAVLLWPTLQQHMQALLDKSIPTFTALDMASNQVLDIQLTIFAIQKRFTLTVRDIWYLQYQLPARYRAPNLITRLKFRAGYDFLLLRVQSGEHQLAELATWWTDYQEANPQVKHDMIAALPKPKRRKRRRQRK